MQTESCSFICSGTYLTNKKQTFPFEITTICTYRYSVSAILSHQSAAHPWKAAGSPQAPNGPAPNIANEAQGMLLWDPAVRICPSFFDLRSCVSDSQIRWCTALISSVPAGPGDHIYSLVCQELRIEHLTSAFWIKLQTYTRMFSCSRLSSFSTSPRSLRLMANCRFHRNAWGSRCSKQHQVPKGFQEKAFLLF